MQINSILNFSKSQAAKIVNYYRLSRTTSFGDLQLFFSVKIGLAYYLFESGFDSLLSTAYDEK